MRALALIRRSLHVWHAALGNGMAHSVAFGVGSSWTGDGSPALSGTPLACTQRDIEHFCPREVSPKMDWVGSGVHWITRNRLRYGDRDVVSTVPG